jgi:hypothetical protein
VAVPTAARLGLAHLRRQVLAQTAAVTVVQVARPRRVLMVQRRQEQAFTRAAAAAALLTVVRHIKAVMEAATAAAAAAAVQHLDRKVVQAHPALSSSHTPQRVKPYCKPLRAEIRRKYRAHWLPRPFCLQPKPEIPPTLRQVLVAI